MRYQTFGHRTGLRMSEYILGTANFGSGPAGADPEPWRPVFDAFAEAGGTTLDTSNRYQDGRSESILGELLSGRRDDFVVITKYGGKPAGAPGPTGNSRKAMVRAVEDSLRRLRTDHVDVLMAHFPDELTPVAEILTAHDDLIAAGKVLYGGLSNFPAWRVAGAVVRADLRGLAVPVGIEIEYSLLERSAERELLPMAEAHGLGVALYSPLAGGRLTGKYRRGETGRLTGYPDAGAENPSQTGVLDAVLAVAAETGSTPVDVSLAWLRARAARSATTLLPVVGPRTPEQLASYLTSLRLDLTGEQYDRLDTAGVITLGVPHDTVAAALASGIDGDHTRIRVNPVPVV